MKRVYSIFAFVIVVVLSFTSNALAQSDVSNSRYDHAAGKYPPIFFYAPVERESFLNIMRSAQKFESVDVDYAGIPIGVSMIVSREQKISTGSAGSALLAATTLGLTRMSFDFVFSVELALVAHGTKVFSKSYQLPRKEKQSIWNPKSYNELRKDERVFANESLQNFIIDIASSPEAKELFEEYYLYF